MRVERQDAESLSRLRKIAGWPVVAAILVCGLTAFWFYAVNWSSEKQVWYTSPKFGKLDRRIRVLMPAGWRMKQRGASSVVLAPVPQIPWLRNSAVRKMLGLEYDKISSLVIFVTSQIRIHDSGIEISEEPGDFLGTVVSDHGNHSIHVIYTRGTKEDFRRTYKGILSSVQLVE